MEAFSDGVIAILITIIVLELKVPHDAGLDALVPLAPVFLSYVVMCLASCIWASTGTTIATFSRQSKTLMAGRSGRTCIFCFGCRSSPL